LVGIKSAHSKANSYLRTVPSRATVGCGRVRRSSAALAPSGHHQAIVQWRSASDAALHLTRSLCRRPCLRMVVPRMLHPHGSPTAASSSSAASRLAGMESWRPLCMHPKCMHPAGRQSWRPGEASPPLPLLMAPPAPPQPSPPPLLVAALAQPRLQLRRGPQEEREPQLPRMAIRRPRQSTSTSCSCCR
jgi:hypothetical protein